MSLQLSIFIIAENESSRIGRTLSAIKDLSDDLIVIDSGSTDGTQEVAESHGARVIFNPWAGYGMQKRFGESCCKYKWRLNLDADEVASRELVSEIFELFENPEEPLVPGAYYLRIVDVMPGDDRPRIFAYAHKQIRLYHADVGEFSRSPVFDVVKVRPDIQIDRIRGPIFHFSIIDIGSELAKYNRYTDALAEDLHRRKKLKPTWRLFVEFPLAFVKAFVLRRHFLRGTYGFITAMNYAIFRYMRAAKSYEYRHAGRKKRS